MIPDHPQHDYRGLRVLIMGLGSFGGGLGAVRFFAARGARVVITDTRTAEKLSDVLSELRDIRDIELKLGGHDDVDFQNADLVVVNPAIPRDNADVSLASTIRWM